MKLVYRRNFKKDKTPTRLIYYLICALAIGFLIGFIFPIAICELFDFNFKYSYCYITMLVSSAFLFLIFSLCKQYVVLNDNCITVRYGLRMPCLKIQYDNIESIKDMRANEKLEPYTLYSKFDSDKKLLLKTKNNKYYVFAVEKSEEFLSELLKRSAPTNNGEFSVNKEKEIANFYFCGRIFILIASCVVLIVYLLTLLSVLKNDTFEKWKTVFAISYFLFGFLVVAFFLMKGYVFDNGDFKLGRYRWLRLSSISKVTFLKEKRNMAYFKIELNNKIKLYIKTEKQNRTVLEKFFKDKGVF